MIKSEDGVAGFFEDLPVLMFVLLGVSALVMSGTWVAKTNATHDLEEELDGAALRIVQRLLVMARDWSQMPRICSLAGMNISASVALETDGYGYAISVACLHPTSEMLTSATQGDVGDVGLTGFARTLFNAIDDQGLVRILEVQVIVWME